MNIPIFLSSDNNYAPFVATTIASICDNTKSFVEVYVLDGGITEENQEKISALKDVFKNFSIEFIKIDLEKECITNSEEKYQKLLKEQIYWLNRNNLRLYKKSKRLYDKYIDKTLEPIIANRCCNFPLFEEKCKEYIQE